jgi:hypothetical protein
MATGGRKCRKVQIHGTWNTDGISDSVALNMTKDAEDFFVRYLTLVLGASEHVTCTLCATRVSHDPLALLRMFWILRMESHPQPFWKGRNTNIRRCISTARTTLQPLTETKSRNTCKP